MLGYFFFLNSYDLSDFCWGIMGFLALFHLLKSWFKKIKKLLGNNLEILNKKKWKKTKNRIISQWKSLKTQVGLSINTNLFVLNLKDFIILKN